MAEDDFTLSALQTQQMRDFVNYCVGEVTNECGKHWLGDIKRMPALSAAMAKEDAEGQHIQFIQFIAEAAKRLFIEEKKNDAANGQKRGQYDGVEYYEAAELYEPIKQKLEEMNRDITPGVTVSIADRIKTGPATPAGRG